MAKSETNKSQAIRDVLQANRRKTPLEIVAILKEQGVNVTATYVSNVKFHSRNRRGRKTMTVRGTARRTKSKDTSSFSNLHSALDFVRAAGGMNNAKAALQTLEQIGDALR